MIKPLKKLFLFLASMLFGIYLLFLYMSSPNEHMKDYYQIVNYSIPSEEQDSILRVTTFNIGYLSGMTNNQSIKREQAFFEANLNQAKEVIGNLDVDILGLQEIDFDSDRSFNVNQMDAIAVSGKFSNGYKSINWDKRYVPFPYWPPTNHFGKVISGQATLSKYPIISSQTLTLNHNMNIPAYYRAFYLDRLLQIAEVDFQGIKVKVMNVHLEAFDKQTRLEQMKVIINEFEKSAAIQPVLLMGDFNSEVPGRHNYKDAIDMLMELDWIASAIPFDMESTHGTYSSVFPERMIDYIFYNTNFLVCDSSKVLSEVGQVSDHLPVWASFNIK